MIIKWPNDYVFSFPDPARPYNCDTNKKNCSADLDSWPPARVIISLQAARAMHDFQEQCQVHRWQVAALHTAKENMASRFATSTEEEIERLLIDIDKDFKNTKKSSKVAKKT